MIHAISPDILLGNAGKEFWLVEGYEPTPASAGVIGSAQAKSLAYPMKPYIGLLHTALGNNLAEFLQDQESAEQALADVSAAYETAAKEGGF